MTALDPDAMSTAERLGEVCPNALRDGERRPASVASASSARTRNARDGGLTDEHPADDAARTHDGAPKASVRDDPTQAVTMTDADDADDADARSAAPSGPGVSGPRTAEDER